MAVNRHFNQLYEHVRDLGLPYEIKESGGSVIIKISADTNNNFRKKEEKFRFHNKRTLNGSNNLNWRAPENFHETSSIRNPSFPNLHFFKTTPPPQRLPSPPPPPRSLDSPSAASFKPTKFYPEIQLTSTPAMSNPYRIEKRCFSFPKTPNLMNISDEVNSSSTERSTVIIFDDPSLLPSKAPQIKPPEENGLFPENVAFIKCMKAIYEGKGIK